MKKKKTLIHVKPISHITKTQIRFKQLSVTFSLPSSYGVNNFNFPNFKNIEMKFTGFVSATS